MYLEVHGARGSMPVGTGEFAHYGGDTTCYSVHHDDGRLIAVVDAGTGLRRIVDRITDAAVPMLITHYHWDHIQGLSMYSPMWRGELALDVVGPHDPKQAIGGAISPPWFPVAITDMEVAFHSVEPEFSLGDVTVTSFPLHHPQGGVGYRFDLDGRSLVVATDHEAGTAHDYRLVEMAQGADILVHDAQYLPEEIAAKHGWGHSTWEQAAKIAAGADVGRVVFASHDPGRSDAAVDRLVGCAQETFAHASAAVTGERYPTG